MAHRKVLPSLVVSCIVTLLLASSQPASAQQSLRDLAAQYDAVWLAGRWLATTEDGTQVRLAFRWAVGGHAVVTDFQMGPIKSHGMVYLRPEDQSVVSLSVDNRGNLSRGTWDIDGDRIVARSRVSTTDWQTREMAVYYTKVDAKAMRAQVYGIEYGQPAAEPWITVQFKRLPRSTQAKPQPAASGGQTPLQDSAAQQTIKALAAENGVTWLAGRWKAATDEGTEVEMRFRWVADGQAAITDVAMGEFQFHGMTYRLPGEYDILALGIDNRGRIAKGFWDMQGDKLVLRNTMIGDDGRPVEIALVHSKVNGRTMNVEMYGVQDGQLAPEPWGTLRYTRQPRPTRSKPIAPKKKATGGAKRA